MASGDFRAMFKGVDIPPLPTAVHRLLAEINKPDPDIEQLVQVISASAGIAAKVIQTVNSSYFGLRQPVTEISRAVMLLGMKNIRSLALAYATMDAVPRPKDDLFDHEAFWTDSLLRAILARRFAQTMFADQGEEAFTAALLADIALPVLLSVWGDYYTPVVSEWRDSPRHLSQIERDQFGWDHAQAGAWIVRSWGFPDEMVCYIGSHNLSLAEIEKHELSDTIVVPLALSSLFSGVLKSDPVRNRNFFTIAADVLNLQPRELGLQIRSLAVSFNEILTLFELSDRGAGAAMHELADWAEDEAQEALS